MPHSFVTPWTVAHQAPLFMGFLRQEYWSGLPFPFPGESSWIRDWTCVSCTAHKFFTTEPPGKPPNIFIGVDEVWQTNSQKCAEPSEENASGQRGTEQRPKEPLNEGERESEKAGLKLNTPKTKIVASGPITSWQIERIKSRSSDRFSFLGLQNHCGRWLQPWN